MVVIRNLLLTVKKTTRQFKTLEGNLMLTTRNGERTSVSSRVAELDQLVPHRLGVSKAVLDYVIFCHQDESLWPMSEPAQLKKKFDEIFEALKYTKAIDNIKTLRKKKAEELKVLKTSEGFTKEIKNRGDKAEKDSRELHAAVNQLRDEIQNHKAKLKEAEKNYRDAFDREATYTTIMGALDNQSSKQEWLQDHLHQLGKNLEKRSESDEWLQTELDEYEERMASHQKLEQEQMRQYQDLERGIKNAEARLSTKHVEVGKYEEQKLFHHQQIEERKALIVETSHKHKIRGYDTDLDDMQINEYMEKITRLCKDQSSAVEKVRCETEQEMRKVQDLLNKLGERRSALTENKNTAKEQVNVNNNSLRAKQSALNSIETDESAKAILEANIEDLEIRLKQARDELNRASWDTQIKDNDIDFRVLNEKIDQVNEELYQGTKQAGELARLDQMKKDAADCQRNLHKMKGVHSDRLQAVVGQTWDPSRLEDQLQGTLDQRSRHVKEAECEREKVSRSLEQVEYKLATAKADSKKAEKELSLCIQQLNDHVEGEPEDYEKLLSDLQDARDLYKADFDNFANMQQYFAKGVTVAREKHQCNLCQRPFHNKELTDFVKKLEAKLNAATAEKVARDLREAEEDLRKAKEVGSSHESWSRLSKIELPRINADIKKLGSERERLLREIEDQDKIVKDKEDAKMDAEALVKPVANILKYHNDFIRLTSQAQGLAASQKDSGLSRTLDEIRSQLQELQSKSQDTRSKGEKLRSGKDNSRTLISTLELDLSGAKNNLSIAKHQLENRQNIANEIQKLKSDNQSRQDNIRSIDSKLQDLAPQYAEEETKSQDIRQRGSRKEQKSQEEASGLLDSERQLKIAARNIAAYIEDGGPAKLDRCHREIRLVEQEIASTKDEQKQVTVSINKVRQEVNNHDNTKRTLLDNINYRRNAKELEAVKAEIAELSAKNDEADRDHWRKQKEHWQRIANQHNMDHTTKYGIAKAKDEELGRLLQDWKTEYKDAAENFKRAHIQVEVWGMYSLQSSMANQR